MAAVLEVVAHPSGPWLVKAGGFLYAVPPGLGRALRPLAGRRPEDRELRACLSGARSGPTEDPLAPEIETWVGELSRALESPSVVKIKGRQADRPIRFRMPLIPARWVRLLAGRLQFLTGNRSLVAMTLLASAGYLVAGSGPAGFSWDLGTLGGGLGLFLMSAVWHELGHAAALVRSGYPAGGIGAGILFVIPVLFADVTSVGVLPRTGRLRVDVSGVVFQLAAGGLFMAAAGWTGVPVVAAQALVLAGSSALLAVAWSLFPFIRSDGYWLLCDLLGLDDLDGPPTKPPSPGLRIFLVVYQLANTLFLLLIGIYFPCRILGLMLVLAGRLGISQDSPEAKWLAVAAGVALVGMMGVGIIRKMAVLIRSAMSLARGH